MTSDILGPWAAANGCGSSTAHYETPKDGTDDLYCVGYGSDGACAGGGAPVVRCAFRGAHQWYNTGVGGAGELAWWFMSQHTNEGHVGKGEQREQRAASTEAIMAA